MSSLHYLAEGLPLLKQKILLASFSLLVLLVDGSLQNSLTFIFQEVTEKSIASSDMEKRFSFLFLNSIIV